MTEENLVLFIEFYLRINHISLEKEFLIATILTSGVMRTHTRIMFVDFNIDSTLTYGLESSMTEWYKFLHILYISKIIIII